MTRTPAVMEIEPCPFCRAHASVFQDDGDYYVSCTECWSQSPLKEEKTEAIAAWNTRTPAEPLADGEMIDRDEALNALHTQLAYPTEACAIVRSIAAYNPNYRLLFRQLRDLAVSLHRRHYPEVAEWKLLDDAPGVLSQIDNMTAGMSRNPNDRLREALEAIVDRAPERDIKWAGMTARDIALAALSHKD